MNIDLTNDKERELLFKWFARAMECCGQGKGWEVRPNEDAEGSWDVGYPRHESPKGKVRFEVCFTIDPHDMVRVADTLTGKRAIHYTGYQTTTYVHHEGRWNPRDGGDPPYTEDVVVGQYDDFAAALLGTILILNEQRTNGLREELDYALLAISEQEDNT